ncbi:MAG: NAD(P)-binding protein [Clostridiaceae bacterium]|nr:NAD(P)-binding protein [Clostridiaceae bacterium]
MSINELLNISNVCIADEQPPCACECPLGLDVRNFIEKICSGFISAAYKLYIRDAVFPGVTCQICDEPCKNVCVRREVDSPISMRELEKYCWEQSRNKPAENYYIPEKKKRILIIGSGATGLSCSVKLAQRGYAVELVEKSNKLGGRLWDIDSKILPEKVLEEELARVTQLKYLNILLNTNVEKLDDSNFDAVLVATGASGDTFGAVCSEDGVYLRNGVFFGGSMLNPGQNHLMSIRQGVELSYLIENFIKVGRMDVSRGNKHVCAFRPDVRNIEPLEITWPRNHNAWTKEEVQEEAKRCLLCSCSNCTDVCDMLQYYRKSAKQYITGVGNTVHKNTFTEKGGLQPIMSCTQCGLCKSVCPVDVDLKSLSLESRKVLHKNGRLPDAKYDYFLNDMWHNNNEGSLLIPPSAGRERCRYVYFPGCQISASDPAYVTESYRWLTRVFPEEMALMLYCCGAPAYWAGNEEEHEKVISEIRSVWSGYDKPIFVIACPSCQEMFQSHLPEIKIVSLWNIMAEKYPQNASRDTVVSIFDPCSSKYDKEVQNNIRKLVRKAGYDIKELPSAGEKARCCGFGGLIYTTNRELFTLIGEQNIAMGDSEFITYCTNCRDTFAIQNKTSRHILDILFFEGEKDRSRRNPSDLTSRRASRILLKKTLMKEFMDSEFIEKPEPHSSIKLSVSPELKEKMNRELIHEENIQKVIYSAEKSGNRVFNTSNHVYTAHSVQGKLTFWVQYTHESDDIYNIQSVYYHRIIIEENDTDERG